MIKVLVFSVLALLLGAFLLPLLQKDPGYILISVLGTTVELRFWFAVFVLLLMLLFGYVGLRTLRHVGMAIKTRWWQFSHRKDRKAQHLFERGLTEYIVGDYEHAEQDFLRSTKVPQIAYIKYLLAAHSKAHLGKPAEALPLLDQAEQQAHANTFEVDLLRAQVLLDQEDQKAALSVLNKLKSEQPKHPQVLLLLKRVYLIDKDWAALQVLAEDMRLAKVMDKTEVNDFLTEVYLAQLNALLTRAKKMGAAATELGFTTELLQLWESIPRRLQHQGILATVYAELLWLTQQHDALARFCRDALQREWSPLLLRFYALAETDDSARQLRHAEKWVSNHEADAQLFLALGQLYGRNQLWGQAKQNLQKSLELEPSVEAFLYLGRLAEALGEQEQKTQWFEKGLRFQLGLPAQDTPEQNTLKP